MPLKNIYKRYAWFPTKTASGKRLWFKEYVLLVEIYFGPAGEEPVFERFVYTTNEWFLEEIKNPSKRSILPSRKNRIFY
jgi:hypothetical protein